MYFQIKENTTSLCNLLRDCRKVQRCLAEFVRVCRSKAIRLDFNDKTFGFFFFLVFYNIAVSVKSILFFTLLIMKKKIHIQKSMPEKSVDRRSSKGF